MWSIKIVPLRSPVAGQTAEFVPDFPGAKPGDPLEVSSGDGVSWNNESEQVHQPWPTDAAGNVLSDPPIGPRLTPNYLSDPVEAQTSSRPQWNATSSPATQNTIFYRCRVFGHENETGKIIIK
jgi:hypothetical protein